MPHVRALVVAPVALCVAVGLALASGCPTDVNLGGKACADTSTCAAGQVCQDGSCIAACTSSASCALGQCDTASGLCVDCLAPDDCGPNLVCNEFSHRCVQPVVGCANDDDCSGLHCDTIKGACVQCISDGDCGAGALCDQLSSTCTVQQGCVNDGDCSGTVCSPTSHVCVECFTGAHCASGACDPVSSTCVAGCTDADPSEPNDGATALALASGGAHEGSICPGDLDEFLVDAAAGDALTATLTLEGAGALVLTLEDASGGLIATATPGGPGLTLTSNGLAAGTVRLIVGGASPDDSGAYLVAVTLTPPAGCTQLDAEPNGTTGQAATIAADNALHSGAICGTDVDLFRFTAAAGDTVDAAAVPGDGAGTLAVALLNAGGSVVATGNPVTLTNVAAGAMFVRVSAAGGDVTYSVRVHASNAPPVCNQTDAEPNDADAQALSLTPGAAAVGGTVCAGDVDQFRFAAAALDDAAVNVTAAGGGVGTLTAKLIRAADGVQVASGLSMSAPNLAAGGYRVVVQGSNGTAQGAYTVQVALTPEPAPDPCTEGGVEPDALASGRALALDGTPLAGRVCAADTDFFTFTLPFTSTVTVHARFTHANGDLDIRLVDSTGATVDGSFGVINDEIVVDTLAPGTYTAEIFGFNGAVNTYTMEATLQGCTPDDGFEDNNAFSRPTPIGASAVSAVRCPGDDDFYALRLETGDALDATLAGSGLTFSLVSSTDGALLQSDAASGGNRRIQAAGLPAGKYLLRVTGSGAARVPYTMTPAISPSTARCIDDGANPNETALAAFPLDNTGILDGSYDVGALTLCTAGDQDWFTLNLPGQKQVTLQLGFNSADDVDVEILEPKGTNGLTRSLARSFAVDKQDHVSGMINAGGLFFLKTIGFRSTPEPYSLGVEIADPPASSCVNDRFDTWTATTSGAPDIGPFKNDDVTTQATSLSASENMPSMRICPGDHDFFALPSAAAGQTITVDVTYVHTDTRDIDVRLWGPTSSTLATSSLGVTGTEHIAFAVTQAGSYFIEVHEFQDDGENFYDMTETIR